MILVATTAVIFIFGVPVFVTAQQLNGECCHILKTQQSHVFDCVIVLEMNVIIM
jgi:hypothetical protein